MYIIGFNGSPRQNGNTTSLLHRMLDGCRQEGAEIEYIHLPSYHIEGCVGCERCRKDKTCTKFFDGMHLLYGKLEKADGIIMGSPTYNYNMTPQMKSFIDRLYPFFDFTEPRPGPYTSRLANRGKGALVFGVCEQVDPKEVGYTVVAMRDAIEAIGYHIYDSMVFAGHFLPNSVAKDSVAIQRATEAGAAFAKALRTSSSHQEDGR